MRKPSRTIPPDKIAAVTRVLRAASVRPVAAEKLISCSSHGQPFADGTQGRALLLIQVETRRVSVRELPRSLDYYFYPMV